MLNGGPQVNGSVFFIRGHAHVAGPGEQQALGAIRPGHETEVNRFAGQESFHIWTSIGVRASVKREALPWRFCALAMASDVRLVDGSFDFSGGVDTGRVTTVQSTTNPHGLS